MADVLYRHQLLDHYKHPRNFGALLNHTHEAGLKNLSCGDSVQFQARVVKGKVADIAFTGTGCVVSVAAASALSEHVKGKALTSIKKLNLATIEKVLGMRITSAREKCALLGLETLKLLSPSTNTNRQKRLTKKR